MSQTPCAVTEGREGELAAVRVTMLNRRCEDKKHSWL